MLVAVDTNVPLELAGHVDDVEDALAVIRHRIKGVRFVSPPTVNLELQFLSEFAERNDVRSAAKTALRLLVSKWEIEPSIESARC
jgi:hypothetical protein